jgi:hypothetical protein
MLSLCTGARITTSPQHPNTPKLPEMSLLDAPNDSEATLQPALPPLRGLAKFGLRYRSATDLTKILSDCSEAEPCLVNDNEVAVKAPSASLAALYRQIDEIFHNGKGQEEQRAEVTRASGAFSSTVKREDFQQYVHWADEHYTRNLVGATEDFEMIVGNKRWKIKKDRPLDVSGPCTRCYPRSFAGRTNKSRGFTTMRVGFVRWDYGRASS